ncbi:MAG TPA: hypothetical protein VJT83_04490 [Chitinophagaceae bacterium]|nr:hypothetical protein [Chitinophagaceae bacterium]
MNWIFNKNTLTIMLSVITSSAFAASVDTFPFPSKPRWKTRIVFNDGTMLNGFTTAKTDSTITLIIAQPDSLGQPRAVTIPFTDVKKIKMRDKYAWSVTQNMLVGAGIGFLLGFALSVQDCDDPDSDCTFIESFFSDSKFENAVKLGTAFSIIGLGAGGLASDKVTFKFKLGKDRKQKPKLPIL